MPQKPDINIMGNVAVHRDTLSLRLASKCSVVYSHNSCRHHENEERLQVENAELAKQLCSCQKDLHDINEFLLNELKVTEHLFMLRNNPFDSGKFCISSVDTICFNVLRILEYPIF